MEQRWKNLKQIHESISNGKRDNGQDLKCLAETEKLLATLKVLLSLEIKSCDQYPSRCLHCHQLLALSVVTMIFEDPYLNELKLFCECLDDDFLNVLMKLVFCKRDLFLVYSSQKAVLAVLNSHFILKKQKTIFLERIMSGLELEEFSQIQSVLEIITSALSSKKNPNLNDVCFNIVSSELTKILHIWKKYQKELDYYVFSVLRKFVKYLNKEKYGVELMDNVLSGAILEFIPVLFSDFSEFEEFCSDNNVISPQSYAEKKTKRNKNYTQFKMATRKLLDFLNEFFNYCSHLILKKNVADIYVLISGNFIHQLTICEFNINLSTNCVGFAGAKESTCKIDFPLARRVILLSLTCFAVTLKHDYKRPISDVLKGLHIFLDSIAFSIMPSADKMSLQWLPLVFEDQDDSYIECLLCLLDIYSWLNRRLPDSTILIQLEPCPLILQLLQTVNFDPSIIMDWLVSPETCFLLYFSRFLKYVINNWFKFTQAAHVRYGTDCRHSEPVGDPVLKGDLVYVESAAMSTDNGNDGNNIELVNTSLEDKKVNQELPRVSPSFCIRGNLEKDNKNILLQEKVDNNVMKLTSSMAAIMTYSDSDDESSDMKCDSGLEFMESSYPNGYRKDSLDLKDTDNLEVGECHDNSIVYSDIDLGINAANITKPQSTYDGSGLLTRSADKILIPCEMKCCDQVMSAFIRVRIQIERLVEQDLFPYNPSPLLSLLNQCEDLYESIE